MGIAILEKNWKASSRCIWTAIWANGMRREEARRRALIELGGIEQVRQAVRDRRGFAIVGRNGKGCEVCDTSALLRTPGFSIVAVAGDGARHWGKRRVCSPSCAPCCCARCRLHTRIASLRSIAMTIARARNPSNLYRSGRFFRLAEVIARLSADGDLAVEWVQHVRQRRRASGVPQRRDLFVEFVCDTWRQSRARAIVYTRTTITAGAGLTAYSCSWSFFERRFQWRSRDSGQSDSPEQPHVYGDRSSAGLLVRVSGPEDPIVGAMAYLTSPADGVLTPLRSTFGHVVARLSADTLASAALQESAPSSISSTPVPWSGPMEQGRYCKTAARGCRGRRKMPLYVLLGGGGLPAVGLRASIFPTCWWRVRRPADGRWPSAVRWEQPLVSDPAAVDARACRFA